MIITVHVSKRTRTMPVPDFFHHRILSSLSHCPDSRHRQQGRLSPIRPELIQKVISKIFTITTFKYEGGEHESMDVFRGSRRLLFKARCWSKTISICWLHPSDFRIKLGSSIDTMSFHLHEGCASKASRDYALKVVSGSVQLFVRCSRKYRRTNASDGSSIQ